ncbi:MAG TPA: hypothetical protein VL403_09000, partial [Candidatus Kryptonia bacterium]|nr:hypothetical protein [Candidatus Kryptonia bacterium]
ADGANLTEIHRPEDLVPGQMRRWNDAWRLSQCGDAVAPGLLREFGGKRIVWRTYPVDGERPCVLTTTVQASSKKQSLDLCVAADAGADSGWGLRVYANDELIEQRVVSSEGGRLRWQPVHCEITAAAPATIRLEHRADGRSQATGYWAYARLTAATEAKPVECTAPESAIEVDAPD